jgi:RNAse (barnase) inhibitor barstar
MTVFSPNEDNEERRDWAILRDGGVALYWRPEALNKDRGWLESNDYNIVEFDAARWSSEEQMHDALRSGLSFPYYYGKNLDALDESLANDLVVPEPGGVALVFHHYDQFAKVHQIGDPNEKGLAEVVLHIFARAVRYHILFGRRLLILVQSDDPRIRFEDLGISAHGNPREWHNRIRGV